VLTIAVEIAFQETTNSVIERKARQAVEWYGRFNRHGNYLCYVMDGAGYFSRKQAFCQIVKNSHKAVTLRQLGDLCRFMDSLVYTSNF